MEARHDADLSPASTRRAHVGIRRLVVGALAAAIVGTTLTGCVVGAPGPTRPGRTEPPVDADTAKQQMIDAVQDATDRLGGTWTPATGPDYAEQCSTPDGDEGAHWRYLVRRDSLGDPRVDADELADRWRDRGMRVARRGTEDRPTVVGSGGGSVSSASLYVSDAGYSVQAVSLCFPGDADEL